MIKCFFIEPTGLEYRYLRRYSSEKCLINPMGYHNEMISLDVVISNDEPSGDFWDHKDERWPKKCICGYEFKDSDTWQLFYKDQYEDKRVEKLYNLINAPEGAMWFAPWLDDIFKPQLEHVLIVRIPRNFDWIIDAQTSNCSIKDDKCQEKHHCWIIEGQIPNVTVSKNGDACSVGGGSIIIPDWHGFLRNGVLES